MWLSGVNYGAFHVESCLALYSRVVLVSPFSIAITSLGLGKRKLVYVLLVLLFVYIARIDFCRSSLSLGDGDWLRLVIVALPGLFYYFFERTWSAWCIPEVIKR